MMLSLNLGLVEILRALHLLGYYGNTHRDRKDILTITSVCLNIRTGDFSEMVIGDVSVNSTSQWKQWE